MSNKTETWNGFETFLTSELLGGELVQMFVDFIPAGLDGVDRPMYLVVEPDKPTQREWIRVKDIDSNLNLFTTLTRGLTGGTSDITHPTNSVIRSVTTKELVDDLFSDIEILEAADDAHAADTGDPHAAAVYLKLAQASSLYVDLTGDVMTGPLTLAGAPTADLQAATRLYVDDAIGALPPPFSQLHADLLDLPDPSAHHVRYDDNEAQNAMGPESDINPFRHQKYSDAEVDTIVGVHAAIVNAHHDRYTDGEAVAAVGPHTDRYTNPEAVAAVLAADDYLRKAGGGTFTGELIGPVGLANNPAYAIGNVQTGMYQDGDYIGLTRDGDAVIVGDGDDELYFGGISDGSGDDLQAQGTQIRRVVSSRRYKNVGKRIDKAAIRAKLMALPVYEWAYKTNPQEQIGWMAEDVAEVDPRLVNFDEEGRPNSIRTLAIMAVLT